MKLLHLITVAALLWNSALQAQTDLPQHRWFTGGSVNFSITKKNRDATSNIYQSGERRILDISLAPVWGWQLNGKTAIGVRPLFRYYKTREILNASTKNERITEYRIPGISVFSRHSIKKFNKLSIQAEPSIQAQWYYLKVTPALVPNSSRSIQTGFLYVGASPLLTYEAASRFRLLGYFGRVGYTYDDTPLADLDYTSGFNFDFGLRNLLLGMEYLF